MTRAKVAGPNVGGRASTATGAPPLLATETEGGHTRFTDAALIGELRRVAPLVMGHLSMREFLRHSVVGPETVVFRFGSWKDALAKAGIRNRLMPRALGSKYTWEECYANMDKLWRRYGRAPRRYEADTKPSAICSATYIARFGSWLLALKAYEAYRGGDRAAWPMPGVRPGRSQGATAHGQAARAAWAARRSEQGYQAMHSGLRLKVMKRDNFCCVLCGASPAKDGGRTVLHIDHKIPLRQGGTSTIDNLRTMCSKCNHGRRGEN